MSIRFSEITLIDANKESLTYLAGGYLRTAGEVKGTRQYRSLRSERNAPSEINVQVQHCCFGCEAPEIDGNAEHLMLIAAYDEFADEWGDNFTNRDDVEYLDYIELEIMHPPQTDAHTKEETPCR